MKELTVQEKAKAYNEAIERAKKLMRTSTAYDKFTIEKIFPELKEEMNKKIKACIKMCLTDANEQRFKDYNTTLKDCLEWLENQEHISETHLTVQDDKSEEISKEIIKYLEQTVPHHHRDEVLKSKEWIAWLENIPYTIDHEKREGFYLGYKAGLEKQGKKSLTVDIKSMIEAYEQRLINQGNGVRNSPIVNMCVAAFKHGVENTLDELKLRQLWKQ